MLGSIRQHDHSHGLYHTHVELKNIHISILKGPRIERFDVMDAMDPSTLVQLARAKLRIMREEQLNGMRRHRSWSSNSLPKHEC